MTHPLVPQVIELASPIASRLGLEIVEAVFQTNQSPPVLRVDVRNLQEEDTGLDDCTNLSKELTEALDESEIIPDAYVLEVSSPGVSDVLTRDRDMEVDLAPRVQIAERANASVFVSIHANAISLSRPDVNGLETYYYSSGFRLAQTIQNNILRRTDLRDRGVRRARFYVLVNTSMPAVLVETGFVTGREDAARFRDPAAVNTIADGIAAGILQHLNVR